MRYRIRICRFALAWAVLSSVGCTKAPTTPTPSPVPQPGSVRIVGVALDADSDAPIPDAIARLLTIQYPSQRFEPPATQSSTTTDANGRFVLNAVVGTGWVSLLIGVSGVGLDPTVRWTRAEPEVDTMVHVYRTLTIRPGESIEFRMFLGDTCGWEDYPCRRVLVESPTGGDVDLEVTPLDPLGEAGLVRSRSEPGVPFPGYQARMTATPGLNWVIGGAPPPALGRTRLTATAHKEAWQSVADRGGRVGSAVAVR